MTNQVRILGPDGIALPPTGRRRSLALAGYRQIPYDAADLYSQHMATWLPTLWSPDNEINIYRDRIVSRVRDAVRNDGWASGAVTRILDNAIGASLRPVAKPNWRWLQWKTQNKGFDHVWSREFGQVIDANFEIWATDPSKYCDATGNQTFSQMAHTAFRHGLVDGDALAILPWNDEDRVPGKAQYATAVQLVDPDRLSNPYQVFDQRYFRGGVEIDKKGRPIAYHIRKAHQGDWWAAADSMTWQRFPKQTEFGRPIVVHYFETHRAGQHRGGAGIFTPVLQRLKMLIKYDSTELDAAIINAIFAAYVESPMDPQLVKEAMGGDEGFEQLSLNGYQADRAAFHHENAIMLGGARIPQMYPGESIKAVSASRPSSNFTPFEDAMLRNVASGLGLSAQQVSNNWGDVNYSSARSAALEAQKTMTRRQVDFFIGFASPVRNALVEEMMDIDDLPLPSGYKPDYISFAECRAAFCQCEWIGPPRGWVNPIDERAGAILGMEAGMSTLEQECLAQGTNFEDILAQRKYEIDKFDELGIPRPEWAGMFNVKPGGGPPDGDKPAKQSKPAQPETVR
ncbi:MAG TPA: phage portal protein [Rhodopila sp.]